MTGHEPPARLILLYHRVASTAIDPFGLCVSPDNFGDQLRILKRRTQPVTLHSMHEAIFEQPTSGLQVAVTFDDGYADNFLTAYPLLRQRAIPATFFVVTGCIKIEREFWWDELERALLHSDKLPVELSLHLDGKLHHWQLDDESGPTVTDYSHWRSWHPPPKKQFRLYTELWRLCHSLDEGRRGQIVDHVLHWAGDDGKARGTHRRATLDEIRQVDTEGMVEIGAHSVTHPSLAQLTPADQWREIVDCKRELENGLDHEVASFSYPYGHHVDVSAETARIVREAGFRRACINVPDRVSFTTDPYRLPRYHVPDIGGADFEVWLDDIASGGVAQVRRQLGEVSGEIERLREAKDGYAAKAAHWQQIALEREQLLAAQRAWIDELETGKKWLEEQWLAWKTLAEQKDLTSQ